MRLANTIYPEFRDGSTKWLQSEVIGGYDQGTTYYVNNVTGLSTNDGLSLSAPVDQVSTAITLSEANRLARAAGNTYVRNIIYVQGTGTDYLPISALPNYTDVIGVGAPVNGDGTGIAIIGHAAGTASAAAGSMRGTRWFNIQFLASGNFYCFDATVAYRSGFYNCSFFADTNNVYAGLHTNGASGLEVFDCHFDGQSGHLVLGIHADAGNFSACTVQNNTIFASTSAILIDSDVHGVGSVVKDNVCAYYTECTIGIDDNASGGYIVYAGNYVHGATGVQLTSNTGRAIGNYVVEGTNGTWVTEMTP